MNPRCAKASVASSELPPFVTARRNVTQLGRMRGAPGPLGYSAGYREDDCLGVWLMELAQPMHRRPLALFRWKNQNLTEGREH